MKQDLFRALLAAVVLIAAAYVLRGPAFTDLGLGTWVHRSGLVLECDVRMKHCDVVTEWFELEPNRLRTAR